MLVAVVLARLFLGDGLDFARVHVHRVPFSEVPTRDEAHLARDVDKKAHLEVRFPDFERQVLEKRVFRDVVFLRLHPEVHNHPLPLPVRAQLVGRKLKRPLDAFLDGKPADRAHRPGRQRAFRAKGQAGPNTPGRSEGRCQDRTS